MRVLFGLNQNADKLIEEKILEKYTEVTGNSFTYDSEYYLAGIKKALTENFYDVLILKEDLEGLNTVSIDYLDQITDKYSDMKIVFIIDDEHEKDDYIKKVFNMGIYNVLYKDDLTLLNIAELINVSRSKMEAKIYLEIDEVENIENEENMQEIPEENLEIILFNLRNATEVDIVDIFTEVSKSYNDKQVLFLISLLPNDILDMLIKSNDDNFLRYHKRWLLLEENYSEKDVKANEKVKERVKIKTETKVKTVVEKQIITKVEKEYLYNIPSDYNKIVAFVGNRKVGTTTIIDMVAKQFTNKGKKIAVLDLTKNKSLFYIKSWGNKEISIEEQRSLEYLNKGIKKPIKVAENYSLYTQTWGEIENFDFYNAIEQIRYDVDVILVDMDFETNYEWLKYAVHSLYIVQDLNIIDIKATKEYLKELIRNGVNSKKMNLVINKYIKCKITTNDILTMFNEPIPDIEIDKDSYLDINKEVFKIDFDIENYIELLESYMYVRDTHSINDEIAKQIMQICSHIYPLEKENKQSSFSFKKLFGMK